MKIICPCCEQEITITMFVNREMPKVAAKDENPVLRSIAEIVCNNSGITLQDFQSISRIRIISKSRQQYMFIVKKFYPDVSLATIGRFIRPDINHTTVIHGIQTIKDLMETSAQEMREMEFLSDRVEEKLLLNKAS